MDIHNFIFGAYPYLAGTIFLAGTWFRFDREQYTWKSDSSQLLSKRYMRWASNLFHVGIISIFFGHFFGMLTPHSWFLALGVSDAMHQKIAIYAGLGFGTMCLIGAVMLMVRRLTNSRVRAVSHGSDIFILAWIMVTLLIGLSTLPVSWGHAKAGDAQTMILLTEWVKSVATLSADPSLITGVDKIYKAHMFFGMTMFLLFPFTRLVHIWSVPLGYLGRAYQIVRMKGVMGNVG
jgi:nitrate reductase gamma subunit